MSRQERSLERLAAIAGLEIDPQAEDVRGVRTRVVAGVTPGWVWPRWLERQLDPRSPAFVPTPPGGAVSNVTGRSWTIVGSAWAELDAVVDPAGLVTPAGALWSLDWWVGAEDRWHVPAREPTLRQRLVGDSPVIETAVRVPSGDVVHRAYAVPDSGGLAVIEVENASPAPVAVAFAVRPYDAEGFGVVERISLEGTTILVDDRPAVLLPRAPSGAAASTFAAGDSSATVFANAAADQPIAVGCDAGLAQAAVVFPLAHRATIRVAIPLEGWAAGGGRPQSRPADAPVRMPEPAPSAADVARGWARLTDRGMRLVLPDDRLASAVDAARRSLLVHHEASAVRRGASRSAEPSRRDIATMLGALGRYGFDREAADVVDGLVEDLRAEGEADGEASGAALHALAEHWRLTRRLDAVDLDVVVDVAARIERSRSRRARTRADGDAAAPSGMAPAHLGGPGRYHSHAMWDVRGLLDAAQLLEAGGRGGEAAQAAAVAADLRGALEAALAAAADRLGTLAVPAGPGRDIDSGIVGSLAACTPLALLDATDPRVIATADAVRDSFCSGPAVVDAVSQRGLGAEATLQLAAVELESGDPRFLDRLRWLLDVASPTWSWPTVVHPQLSTGSGGHGQDGVVAAELLTLVRRSLVRDRPDGLALLTVLPEGWLGQPVEVHDAPTHHGTLSFAVRWHDDRAALLWEVRPHVGVDEVRITAPGLDPAWSAAGLRGEALLGPVDVARPGAGLPR